MRKMKLQKTQITLMIIIACVVLFAEASFCEDASSSRFVSRIEQKLKNLASSKEDISDIQASTLARKPFFAHDKNELKIETIEEQKACKK